MPEQPFGLWPSPITPRGLAGDLRIYDVQWDSDGRRVVWHEGRGARGVLVCADARGGDAPRDLTPGDLAVRARVGYGGGDFCVGHGAVFFAEGGSGRIFRQPIEGGPAAPVTPAFGHAASPALSPDGRWLLYVHSDAGVDCLAICPADGGQWPQRLVTGHDFFMQPCWHPAGDRVAFVAWDFPNMPWDGTGLYLVELDLAGVTPAAREVRLLAGGPDTAIFQPAFSPDGRTLAYVSDETGWGQIYLRDLADGAVRQLTDVEAEHAQPAWAQGMRTFCWSHDSARVYLLRNRGGVRHVMVQPAAGGPAQPLGAGEGYTWFEQPAASPAEDRLAGIASSSVIPARVVLADGARTHILRRSSSELVPAAQMAAARPVIWPTAGGATAHGLLYLPPGYTPGQDGPRPPAIIRIHGGPTGQAEASYSAATQFFVTRGYAVLDVNYRGSTGYGRPYMLALRDSWGVCDVEDAASAARYLGESGAADPGRLVIYGGSAGGYTVLESLCRAPGTFRAGICLYGVANLFTLAADTHKFEARYLDLIVGPLPETADRYRDRSPIFHADLIRDPIAVFQGAEDNVVPPAQAEEIVAALRRGGVPHIYQLYPGEGHGWRRPETIEAFYTSVEAFLRQHVLFA
ncbi:S9 family peptidase [Oscillochloris sp. ZM17-4]|uniref:S9 family peptidase n=1 Tax=Oscillochloris sp. ZM17-4 TaxID=2866714 RepID=UPI001C73283A|nr:S9 family peptidase [Oscillochloris sp. ZM17-4]MBX0330737.1 S9 family peptidase [Oscillochloris sp. ZM17-4]